MMKNKLKNVWFVFYHKYDIKNNCHCFVSDINKFIQIPKDCRMYDIVIERMCEMEIATILL